MKLTTKITACSFVIASSLLAVSCVKQTGKEVATEQTDFSNKAFVQVFNSSINTTARNYVYVDGNPVNGASVAYAASFPATSTPAYFSVNSGIRAFLIRDTLVGSVQPPMSFAENFEVLKYYTIFMYDTSTLVKQKTVINNIIIPADNTARLRFANFAYSPVALPAAFDIFSVKRNANVFTNVSLTEVTDYIPYTAALTDSFYIRLTGTTTNLQNFVPSTTSPPGAFVNILATLNPTSKRSYTLIFRGGYRAITSTNGTVRTLSTFANN